MYDHMRASSETEMKSKGAELNHHDVQYGEEVGTPGYMFISEYG